MSESLPDDVRPLAPLERHKRIGDRFRDLAVGESFVFINDHDPKALFYELQSLFGEVVGWEYLTREGKEWTVRVTRTGDSTVHPTEGVSTVMNLRKIPDGDALHAVSHRYGMMEAGDTMELISDRMPMLIRGVFRNRFPGKHSWEVKKETTSEVIIHLTKLQADESVDSGIKVVTRLDLRPHPPGERHEIFHQALKNLAPGEAFEFTNDHDPKPLHYQIKVEESIPFQWDYMEFGPVAWRVRVTRPQEA